MHEVIQQRIPAGGYSPEEQVELALAAIFKAARHLEFSGIDELETALVQMQKPLVFLAAAGVLAEMTFALHDQQGIYGAKAILDPDGIEDFEEVDLSRLRLAASSEASGRVEIVCLDGALTTAIVGEDWLPQASYFLEFNLVNTNISGEEIEGREEETDGDDNDDAGWRERDGEDGDLFN
jgi:hypothetical protein